MKEYSLCLRKRLRTRLSPFFHLTNLLIFFTVSRFFSPNPLTSRKEYAILQSINAMTENK